MVCRARPPVVFVRQRASVPFTLNPITQARRKPVLDALRGFALLGILLINIEVMRSPDWFVWLKGGTANPPSGLIDSTVGFAIGWLAPANSSPASPSYSAWALH